MRLRQDLVFAGGGPLPGGAGVIGFGAWTRQRPHELGDHDHPREWEVLCLVRGLLDWKVDGVTHRLRSGDVVVVPPGGVHSGINLVLHRCEVAWLILPLPPDHPVPGLDDAQATLIATAFRAMAHQRFPGGDAVLAGVAGLLGAVTATGPLADVAARARLHLLLAAVIRAHAVRPVSPDVRTDAAVRDAAALLRERLGAPMRVEQLARAVGLGRTTLHERFVAELGLSPLEYANQLRVERAKELLAEHGNAATARILGFASAQHFASLFKRATGMTPGTWRKQAR